MDYAFELIQSSLGDCCIPHKQVRCSGQKTSLTIYCLQDMGNDNLIPLNRYYNPLGIFREKSVNYDDYEFLFIKKDKVKIDFLWDDGMPLGTNRYFFYSDCTDPSGLDNFIRYRNMINSVFIFNHKASKDKFMEFWKYKFKLDQDGWERNLSKFEN